MSYEMDEQFNGRITAHLRSIASQLNALPAELTGKLLHGTTIGAFFIEDGQRAIAFSDGKVSMGNKPVHLGYRKILTVDRFTRLLISGSPSLGMAYAAAMKAYIGYREDTSDQPVSARAKARYLGRLLMGGIGLAGAGIVCAPLMVTYDVREKKRSRIFSLGFDGSEVEHDTYATSGSGTNIDVSFRKDWRPAMTLPEGLELARYTIKTLAPDIDSFSGGKVSIDLVGPEGAITVE